MSKHTPLVWHNVNQFSAMVEETKHEGHQVEILGRASDVDHEVEDLLVARCTVDGEEFETFAGEVGLS